MDERDLCTPDEDCWHSTYRRICNNSYTLLIRTPLFLEKKKDANFCTLIHLYMYVCENEITIILFFIQHKRKHCEMV